MTEVTPTLDRPPFRQAIQTSQIIEILRVFQPGQEIHQQDICQKIGCNLAELDKTSWLQTAYLRLERDHSMVFKSNHRVIRRLTSDEIRQKCHAEGLQFHRKAKRRIGQLGKVKVADLSGDQLAKFNATITVWGFLEHVSKPSAQKKIASQVQAVQQQLPIAATLGLFLGQHKQNRDNGSSG